MKIALVEQRRKDMGLSVSHMAEALGIDVSTYYRKKQNNGDGFTAVDLNIFKRELQLNEQEALDFLLG